MESSAPNQERYVTVDDEDIGLDRANIRPNEVIELPQHDETAPALESSLSADNDHDLSKRERLRERKDHAMDKIKKVLHVQQGKSEVERAGDDAPILAPTVDEPSDSRLVQDTPKPVKKTMKDLVHNPVDTAKEKASGQGSHQAAANIAAKEISHGEEVDMVRAHDRFQNAQTVEGRQIAEQHLDTLIEGRQNMFVRWTMDRHLTKVRRLPREGIRRKTAADFEKVDPIAGRVMDWRGYFQHVSSGLRIYWTPLSNTNVVARVLRPGVWRPVYRLGLRSTEAVKGNHHAKCGAPAHRLVPHTGVHHDHPPRLSLGSPFRDLEISGDIFHPLVP
jgi:hypothetical protein